MIDACFLVAKSREDKNLFCAVRRRDGSIGFPGGKREYGELPFDCVLRETEEEGFSLNIMDPQPICCGPTVSISQPGKIYHVMWFALFDGTMPMAGKKKEGEVTPIRCTLREILESNPEYHLPFIEWIEETPDRAKEFYG